MIVVRIFLFDQCGNYITAVGAKALLENSPYSNNHIARNQLIRKFTYRSRTKEPNKQSDYDLILDVSAVFVCSRIVAKKKKKDKN